MIRERKKTNEQMEKIKEGGRNEYRKRKIE